MYVGYRVYIHTHTCTHTHMHAHTHLILKRLVQVHRPYAGFKVQGVGCRLYGFGFGVQNGGIRVYGLFGRV